MAATRNPEKHQVDWNTHVEQCRHSGLNRSQYARTHHLNYDQFNYRYRKAYPIESPVAEAVQPEDTKSDFIQVHVLEKKNDTQIQSTISIVTPDGLKVELGQRWAPRDVVDFLRLWGDAS